MEGAAYIEISDCENHDVFYGIGFADGAHDFELNRLLTHHFELYGVDVDPQGGADCYNGTFNDCIAHTGRDPGQNVDGFDISSPNSTLDRFAAYNCSNGGFKLWADNVTLTNCLSYPNVSANVELDWGSEGPGRTTYSGQDANSLVAYTDTEIFVNPATYDLYLLADSPAVDNGTDNGAPRAFMLSQNYPDPFNPSTTIEFAVMEGAAGTTTLAIDDLRGRQVRALVDRSLPPGPYPAIWDGRNDRGETVPSGIYLYRLDAGGVSYTRKMMVLK